MSHPQAARRRPLSLVRCTSLVLIVVGVGCSNSSFSVAGDGGTPDAAVAADTGCAPDGDVADATPNVPFLVRDTFTRTTVSTLGEADVGGLWTTRDTVDSFAVARGTGLITLAAPTDLREAFLLDVASSDADLQATFSLDSAATGGGVFTSFVLRAIGTSDYRATAVLRATGSVDAILVRRLNGTDSSLGTSTAVLKSLRPQLRIRAQAFGVSPTRLRVKVWEGAVEPASWQLDMTDPTPALQAKGGVGIGAYLSNSATVYPVTFSFDDYFVRPASLLPD